MARKVNWWTWGASMNIQMEGGDFATSEGVHAIAFNENTAYITNQTVGTISVVNISTHTVSSNISLGSKPNGNV